MLDFETREYLEKLTAYKLDALEASYKAKRIHAENVGSVQKSRYAKLETFCREELEKR